MPDDADPGLDDDGGNADTGSSGTGVESESPSPEDSFARLGNEIRLSILRTLHEQVSVGDRSEQTVPYSQLRQAVGEEDSGKFGYHLNRLLGEFVEKWPDGYAIRYPGKELVRTVKSGAVTATERGESEPVDAACYLCGSPVIVSYTNGYISACCTRCRGALDFDFMPEGALSSIPVPAGAVGDAVETAPLDLLDRVHGRYCHRSRSFGDGSCPRCGGTAVADIRACSDHDDGEGPCSECGITLPATVQMSCRVCGEGGLAPAACVASHRDPFRDALAHAGVGRLGYDAFAIMAGWPIEVVDHDGATAISYDLPTEPSSVVIDEALEIHAGG